MRTEDLFKYGVTPKEGENAGKRFIVDGINKAVVLCHNADDETHKEEFPHGSYDLWHEPKTLFEDDSVPATWGNLKKAMAKAGLNDDTRIRTVSHGFFFSDVIQDASAKIIEVDGKKTVLFY